MPNIGPLEIVIVLVIVLLIFGPKRLPDLGKSLGRGMREFKDSVTGKDKDEERARLDEPRADAAPTVTQAATGEETPAPPAGTAKPTNVS